MEKEVYLKITGRVQGIGYRRWAHKIAHQIGGIEGWVRNVEDGSVEVFMRGQEELIERMILACREGPLFSRVDNVVFKPAVIKGFLPDVLAGKFEII